MDAARLTGAAGGVRLRVEVHEELPPGEIGEAHLPPVLVGERECRGLVAGGEAGHGDLLCVRGVEGTA